MKRIEIALFMVILGLLLITSFTALMSPEKAPTRPVAATVRPASTYLE